MNERAMQRRPAAVPGTTASPSWDSGARTRLCILGAMMLSGIGACERFTPVELDRSGGHSLASPHAVRPPVAGTADATMLLVLADLIRGDVPVEVAPSAARMLLENNTVADVYLTPRIDELTGRYSATWTSSRALLLEVAGASDCLAEQTCTLDPPPEPRIDPLIPDAVPASYMALRVVRQGTGQAAACTGCDPGEFALPSHGHYQLEAVTVDLGFLVPPEVDRARVASISVGPVGDTVPLTGVDNGIYVHCARQDDFGRCTQRRIFQLYQAMLSATIEIDRLTMSGKTSPTPRLTPRTPQPPADPARASTFSEPVSVRFTWTTQEHEVLPDPG